MEDIERDWDKPVAEAGIAAKASVIVRVGMLDLGAGTGSGDSGKSFIYKAEDGLYLDYHSQTDGKIKRAAFTDAGVFISPYQFTALDVYTNGFIANYAGDKVTMKWTTDSSGRITSLTDASGSTTTVTWHDTAM